MARILVVDDEPMVVDLVRGLLEAVGHSVLAALDGLAALQVAREEKPDAIVLDIMMPEMDGYEVCRRLKADPALRRIPIVIVTASDDRQLTQKAFEVGALSTLTKPFQIDKLRSAVELALRSAARPKPKPAASSSA